MDCLVVEILQIPLFKEDHQFVHLKVEKKKIQKNTERKIERVGFMKRKRDLMPDA